MCVHPPDELVVGTQRHLKKMPMAQIKLACVRERLNRFPRELAINVNKIGGRTWLRDFVTARFEARSARRVHEYWRVRYVEELGIETATSALANTNVNRACRHSSGSAGSYQSLQISSTARPLGKDGSPPFHRT